MTAPPSNNPKEAGLQAERTALAWRRTALSFGAVAALLAHHGLDKGGPTALTMAGVLASVGVASAAFSHRRYHVRRVAGLTPTVAPLWLTALVSAAVAIAAIAMVIKT